MPPAPDDWQLFARHGGVRLLVLDEFGLPAGLPLRNGAWRRPAQGLSIRTGRSRKRRPVPISTGARRSRTAAALARVPGAFRSRDAGIRLSGSVRDATADDRHPYAREIPFRTDRADL